HYRILDPVVNHLHIMPSTTRPKELATRTFRFSSNSRQHSRDLVVCFAWSSRHNAGAFERSLFSAAYAHAHVVNPPPRKPSTASFSILKERVSTVNDNVAFLEKLIKIIQRSINRRSSSNHEHDTPRMTEI